MNKTGSILTLSKHLLLFGQCCNVSRSAACLATPNTTVINHTHHSRLERERDDLKRSQKGRGGVFYQEKIILGYSREKMCKLVFDVARYKEFVPWCTDSVMLGHDVETNVTVGASTKPKKVIILSHPHSYEDKTEEIVESPCGHGGCLAGSEQDDMRRQKQVVRMARLQIGYPPIKESYTSRVTLVRPDYVQAVSSDSNLFEYLITEWCFHPYLITDLSSTDKEKECASNSCIVEFYVSFKFRSFLYASFSKLFLDKIFKQMVNAFTKRAQQLYGQPSLPTTSIFDRSIEKIKK